MQSIRFIADAFLVRVWQFILFIADALLVRFRDVAKRLSELPPRPQSISEAIREQAPTEPRYLAQFGPQIQRIDRDTGAMQIAFRFYLPARFGSELHIRGRFTNHRWVPMQSTAGGHWVHQAQRVEPGDYYEFRFQDPDGNEQKVTDPLAYRVSKQFDPVTKQYDQFAMVPNLAYEMRATIEPDDRGLCIMECTLPGLLANWEDGDLGRWRSGKMAI